MSMSHKSSVSRMALLAATVLALWTIPASAAPEGNLHYLVVDRSYSILTNKLIESITTKATNVVNDLGVSDEVRIVFFSSTIGETKTWPSMTPDAKKKFVKHFKDEFKPKGVTLLYDTVNKVLDEVLPVADAYSEIKVHIFSDGDDSTNGTIRTWGPVVEKACELIRKHPNGLVSMYTVGFTPSVMPADCIRVVRVEADEERVPPPPPRAAFEAAPLEVLVGEPVTFFARQSPGAISTLEWYFGDGRSVTGTLENADVVKHAYTEPGKKTVRLAAIGVGGRDETTKAELIHVRDVVRPKASFRWTPQTPRVGESVTFINESSGEPETYAWTLGPAGASTNASPTVTFPKAGSVSVSLRVQKGAMTHGSTQTVNVVALLPDPSFEVQPSRDIELGASVRLVAVDKAPDVRHRWLAPDGVAIDGQVATLTPGKAGELQIVHEVSGPGGLTSAVDRVFVRSPEIPNADFDAPLKALEPGESFTVKAKEDKPGSVHHWTAAGKSYSGSEATVSVDATGTVEVVHEVTLKGQTGRLMKPVTVVEPARVIPRFTASPRKGTAPLTVQFEDETDGVVASYVWDFGDGGTDTVKNPSHVYTKAGDYAVTLTVENKFGQRSKTPDPVVIRVKAPMPAWVPWSVLGGILAVAGLVVFKKLQPVPPGGSLYWELQDGTRSKPVDVTGTRFDLAGLKVPGCKLDGIYTIAVNGGKRVLLKDGEVHTELGRDKKFRVGGVTFKYLNTLLDE